MQHKRKVGTMIKKIYINPGHSDKDPGAVGYETERKLNVKVSTYMSQYLQENYICEIRMNPGTMDSLSAIANDANEWCADLFVSNHFNAAGGDGYEALVYNQKRVALGKIFAKHVKAAGQNLRSSSVAPGVKIRTDLSVLKKTAMPSILNEGAFVDNLKDIQDWNDDAELQVLGAAYAEAAAEFLNLEKKSASEQLPAHEAEPDTIMLRTLKKGDKGNDVRAMQILLAGNGCKGKMIESGYGSFGKNTEGAVKLYQKKIGAKQTGEVDLALWRCLLGV